MVIGAGSRELTFQSGFLILGSLQGAGNKFFHENHCANFLFTDGAVHPVSGDKTKRFYLIFHNAGLSGISRAGTKSNPAQFFVSKARHDVIVEHAD